MLQYDWLQISWYIWSREKISDYFLLIASRASTLRVCSCVYIYIYIYVYTELKKLEPLFFSSERLVDLW